MFEWAGRLTRQTDPKGNATAYSYTADGIISAVTDANDNILTATNSNIGYSFTYGEANRMLTATHSRGYRFAAVGFMAGYDRIASRSPSVI